ncbi:MAG TPA: hypothetical protein VG966_13925 [Hyphomicrobiaceae bacterium]|jgi:hypothetical protein|nr:hypothetical protein [Hyphomicrobiaceae bacterium]
MPKVTDNEPSSRLEGLRARWRAWWQRYEQTGTLDRAELEHIAGDLGLAADDLTTVAAKGPRAKLLLFERMAALGLAQSDVERIADGLMDDLQRGCAGCSSKDECKKDLASRPDDLVWAEYCPNSLTLTSLSKLKGRGPI